MDLVKKLIVESKNRLLNYSIIAIVWFFMALGCSSPKQGVEKQNLNPLSSKQDLSVSINYGGVLIGRFTGLAIDRNGNLYAADGELQKIHVFTPTGTFVRSIGRKGKGPGSLWKFPGNCTSSRIPFMC